MRRILLVLSAFALLASPALAAPGDTPAFRPHPARASQ